MATPDQLWIKVTWGIVTWRFGPNGTEGRLPLLGFGFSDADFGCEKASWAYPATATDGSYAGKIPLKGAVVKIYNGPDEDQDCIWIGRIASVEPDLTMDRAMISLVARGYSTHTADDDYEFSHTWPASTPLSTIFTEVRDLKCPKLSDIDVLIDGGRTLLHESPDVKHMRPQEIFNWAVNQGSTGDQPLTWGVKVATVYDEGEDTYTAVPTLFLAEQPDRETPFYALQMADGIRCKLRSDLDEIYNVIRVWYGRKDSEAYVEAEDTLAIVLYNDTPRVQTIEPGRYETEGEAQRVADLLLEQHKEQRLAGAVIEFPYQVKVVAGGLTEVAPEEIQVGQWIEIPDLSDTGGVPEGSYLITNREYLVSQRKTRITLGRQKNFIDAVRQVRTEPQEAQALTGQPRVQTIQTLPQALQTFFAQADGGTEDNPPVLDEDEHVQMVNIPDGLKNACAGWGVNNNGTAVPLLTQSVPFKGPASYLNWEGKTDAGDVEVEVRNEANTLLGTINLTGPSDSGVLDDPLVIADALGWAKFTVIGTPTATWFTVALAGTVTS